jgi:hypothetical protein
VDTAFFRNAHRCRVAVSGLMSSSYCHQPAWARVVLPAAARFARRARRWTTLRKADRRRVVTLPEMAAADCGPRPAISRFMIAINRAWTGAPTRRKPSRGRCWHWGRVGARTAVDTVGTSSATVHDRTMAIGLCSWAPCARRHRDPDEWRRRARPRRDHTIGRRIRVAGHAVDNVRRMRPTLRRRLAGRFQYAPRFVSPFTVSGDSLVGALNNSHRCASTAGEGRLLHLAW